MESLVETIQYNTRVSKMKPDEQLTWAELPNEVLALILSHLPLRDNIRASSVCKTWLAAAISVRIVDKPMWLMSIPQYGDFYYFYDPPQMKRYALNLPELRRSSVCYARDCWLLMTTRYRVFFFCPYTRESIELPYHEFSHQNVAFSASPKSPTCVVFAIQYVSQTAVNVSTWRPGATEWGTVTYPKGIPIPRNFWDKIICSKGVFYCMDFTGWLGVYDSEKSTWTVHAVPRPNCRKSFYGKDSWKGKFVAENNGDIFAIFTYSTREPIVYKLDLVNVVWVKMKSLGGMTIFASYLSSYAKASVLGTMNNNVCFSRIQISGKRGVTYSLENRRYNPPNPNYDWEKYSPFESIWIEPPGDLSGFYWMD